MLQHEAIQAARALLDQPAAERRRELRAAFPGYLRYLLYHLFAWPFLAYRGLRTAKQRNEIDLIWRRLSGGTHPSNVWPRNGTVIVSTDLGETRTAMLAIEQILHADPEAPIALLVMMKRSYEFAGGQSASFPVGYVPYNNPISVMLMLKRWNPRTVIFSHHNLDHHHMTYLTKWLGINTVIINASLTESDAARRHRQEKQRSFISWRRTEIGAWAAQTEIDRQRLLDLGIDNRRIVVTGPLYASTARTAEKARALTAHWSAFLNTDQTEDVPVVVAGSTYPPEEELLLKAFAVLRKSFPGAILVLAPRALNREGGPDSTLKSRNVTYVRRSQVEFRPKSTSVVLLDTFGELKDIYAAADAAHIGGSFDKIVGSHTPVEALAWGIPMTIGPHFTQQVALVDNLTAGSLLTICHNSEELAGAWIRAAGANTVQREQVRQRSLDFRQDRVMEELYHALLQEPTGL